MKEIFHKHHIIPKHMGGTDDPDNIVELSVEEHAEAHRLLYETYGNKFDYIAYMALSKQISAGEASYMKLFGPKNWSPDGLARLSEAGKKRTGERNGFYGKNHSEATKQLLREKLSGENSWIKGIDPAELPYTKNYKIQYPDGTVKVVAGLKAIAQEFDVSIANVYATIGRIKKGNIPKRGVFANVVIQEIE